jgi:hypothetical protein
MNSNETKFELLGGIRYWVKGYILKLRIKRGSK